MELDYIAEMVGSISTLNMRYWIQYILHDWMIIYELGRAGLLDLFLMVFNVEILKKIPTDLIILV